MNSFLDATIYSYKNLVGEYPTASGFATWLSTHILAGKKIPKEAIYRNSNRTPKNILIYNNISAYDLKTFSVSRTKLHDICSVTHMPFDRSSQNGVHQTRLVANLCASSHL